MTLFTAELLKLRRSQVWIVVLVLPLALAGLSCRNTVFSGRGLEDGWHTLWLRTVVFYGLFPLALGVAAIASLVWRAEHRHGNWNALLTGAGGGWSVAAAKAGAVAVLTTVMNLVLFVAYVVLGKVAFGLPGLPPTQYLLLAVLIVVASTPLAAAQSALSLLIRSFATPVAVALVGAAVGLALLAGGVGAAIFVLPPALSARGTQLGTGVFGAPTEVGFVDVGLVLAASAWLTVATVYCSGLLLERRDVRAG